MTGGLQLSIWMQSHRDLDVWKVAMDLVSEVYRLTKKYPKEELFSLTSQIRRCAVSIPSNIAEGAARNGKKEFIQFLYIALGSCAELETQLLIARKLDYPGNPVIFDQLDRIRRMLLGLIRKLRNSL